MITNLNSLNLSKQYTYADYLTWQFSEMVELLKGKVALMSPAPLTEHQMVTGRIFSDLESHIRRSDCRVFIAPFDVRLPVNGNLNDDAILTVVQPDICIVCDAEKKVDRRGCLGAPDMIAEVLSPGNMNHDIKRKYDLYEEAGVREYWIVSPAERNILVYLLENGKYRLQGEYSKEGDKIPVHALVQFSLDWDEVFL